MKVLVTGGAGYLGTELVDRLNRRDDVREVVVYDNLSRPNYNLFTVSGPSPLTKVKFVRGDVLDSRGLRNVLRDIEVVYHLAARVSTPYSDESAHLYEQVNHWGTAELVTAVEESGASMFIFLSSAAVYGFSDAQVMPSTPPNPKTFYGSAKLRAEQQVHRLSDKIETIIVRCANVYGYSRSIRFDAVINRFMFSAHVAEPMIVHGSGRQIRSFVSVENTAKCLEYLLDAPNPGAARDLVDRTMSIVDLTCAISSVYPNAETLFVSQHVEPRHVKLSPAVSLGADLRVLPGDLTDELRNMASRFATGARGAH